MDKNRFLKQMDFILEIDKAKNIFRQTYLSDAERKENDAEHSWHIAIMAFVLAEYFEDDIDVLKVIKMTLMHDIVEIYAGDTYCYDIEANKGKSYRENESALKVYGLLPDDQKKEFIELWQEFEEGKTAESNFAIILDRLQPILLNYSSNGKAWLEHEISKKQVVSRNERIINCKNEVTEYFNDILENAVNNGWLKQ